MSEDIDSILTGRFNETCAKLGIVPTAELRTSVFSAIAKGITPSAVFGHWVTLTRPPLKRRRTSKRNKKE